MINEYIAGDPMDEKVRWVKLTRSEISEKMRDAGIKISRRIIKKLLKKHNFVKRKMERTIAGGRSEYRDEQFNNIIRQKTEFLNSKNPVISMDTKKKELLGDLHRDGSVYCQDMNKIIPIANSKIPIVDDFQKHNTSILITENGEMVYLLDATKQLQQLISSRFIQQISSLQNKKFNQLLSTLPILDVIQKLSKIEYADIAKLFSLFVRDGAIKVNDHDYVHLATGKIVPHGIYDIKQNKAYINIGNSNETAEFACDSIKLWWEQSGKTAYPDATEILIFCDAGGSNSYRHNIFKVELQNLVNAINIPIKIVHYPPYTSKWNPIEHRVFPHVTKALSGVVLKTEEDAQRVIATAKTKTGLSVITNVIKKTYEKGKKVATDFIDNINIKREKSLGQFNYTISPMVIS